MRYPADPPTVDEIVAVMRYAADDRHGWRIRAMIVVLWRAGLRVQEALTLAGTTSTRAAGGEGREHSEVAAAPVVIHVRPVSTAVGSHLAEVRAGNATCALGALAQQEVERRAVEGFGVLV
jgi:integrase